MSGQQVSPLLRHWQRLRSWPGGRTIFSRLIGWRVPYAATIGAVVEDLEPGRAVVRLADRRHVRNHLGSVHAAALINLAELTANLALLSCQPQGSRWIVTGFDSEFVKLARGPVRASCTAPAIAWTRRQDTVGLVEVRDRTGDVVMRARPRWRTEPVPVPRPELASAA